jgi:GMP synthase (glutamine-hydrolysing)
MTVLVVDFGAQYAQLIARRVREAHVYSEIVSRQITAAEIREKKAEALILSGGPASVYTEDGYRLDPAVLDLGIPILGICYGHQLLADLAGGSVARTDLAEFGRTKIEVVPGSHLLGGLPSEMSTWMSHRDTVVIPPPGFRAIASSQGSVVAAMEDPERRLFGVQFHPEVSHTERGEDVFKKFLYDICGFSPVWTSHSIIESAIERVRQQVGSAQVICGL